MDHLASFADSAG